MVRAQQLRRHGAVQRLRQNQLGNRIAAHGRYNGYASLEIVGEAAPGVSTGTAMNVMEQLVSQLPLGVGLQWTGASLQERLSGSQAPVLYTISLLVVFLCGGAL